ncbi:barbed-end actin filament uncapping [Tritrichomonas musculus]|uniref:Barbed-end actin filament uncapping n=1 Tax=Tritrichomonas musculus TaxID=1915356 RepID=A0ABR2LA89_9EUKA
MSKIIHVPVRDNVPLSIFYPEEKRSSHEKKKKKETAKYLNITNLESSRSQIIKQFPAVQNRDQDCFFCQRAILKINSGRKFMGAVVLSLHFAGFFKYENNSDSYTLKKWVHLFEIYSIRIKKNNKALLFCRKEKEGAKNGDEVVNVQVNSPSVIDFISILYRNYMLSTVVYDPDDTCDFRTFDEKLFPPFKGNLSPSQAYQLTYFCFCSRLNLPYKHEITRFYHEHICNFDGFFDFSLLSNQVNLIPAIYAMMFVPYVMAIICHEFQIANISQSIELIIRRSNFLRALHLARCNIDEQGMIQIGKSLCENLENYNAKIIKDPSYQKRFPVPIPIRYWNFENNKFSDATDFFKGLRDLSFKTYVFYLSFSNCGIEDISLLFKALASNPYLHRIKYLFFNGNQMVGKDDMNVFINHLNELADNATQPERKKRGTKCMYESLGVSGKPHALKLLFETLIKRKYVIKELSLAGSEIVRKKKTDFYTPSLGAAALIDYFNHAKELRVVDLSAIQCDRQDLSLILQGLNNSKVINRIHVKLNSLKTKEDDYAPLLSIGKAFLYTNLEKWESLEFAYNYLSSFELDFLLSIFIQMENLNMLNLSYNFKKTDDSASQVLERLSQLKNLTKLYIAGSIERSLYLPKQLDGLLTRMIDIGRLEELDISGNQMGDKCYDFVIQLLSSCPKLNTLIIDQNYPENFILFENVIHRAMNKENLIFFPFPSIDMMNSILNPEKGIGVSSLDPDDLDQLRWYLINLRYRCNVKINQHRKNKNLPPQLPFKAVKELGEMINEVNSEMRALLRSGTIDNPIYIHGCVAKDIHVPLPYVSEKQRFPNEREFEDISPYCEDPQEILEKYHLQYLFKGINEQKVRKINRNYADISNIRNTLKKPIEDELPDIDFTKKPYLINPDVYNDDDDGIFDATAINNDFGDINGIYNANNDEDGDDNTINDNTNTDRDFHYHGDSKHGYDYSYDNYGYDNYDYYDYYEYGDYTEESPSNGRGDGDTNSNIINKYLEIKKSRKNRDKDSDDPPPFIE